MSVNVHIHFMHCDIVLLIFECIMVINIPNCIDEYTNFLLVSERETMNVMVINIPNCIDEYTNFLLVRERDNECDGY